MKKYAEKNLLNIYFKILKIFVVIIALFMGICIYVLNYSPTKVGGFKV